MNTRALGWWSYLVLGLAFVACVILYWLLPVELEGWRGFALNLLTEILGILLTVLLIDAVLRRREDRERARYRALALRQLWKPLNRQAGLFSDVYKAAAERRPEREISGVADLFGEDYFETVRRLDATAASGTARSVGDERGMPWYELIEQEMQGFKGDLGRVVDKYATYLDADTIDVAERLIDSTFIDIGRVGRIVVDNARHMGHQGPIPMPYMGGGRETVTGQGVDPPIREYTAALVELVKIHDETADDDRKVRIPDVAWRDDMAPKIGSGRIPDELMRDERDREHGEAGKQDL